MFYGITIGRRYTNKQKAVFVKHIRKEAKALGYDVALQSKQLKMHALHNIIIGNLQEAKKVVVAAYDTPSKIYVPDYKYYPFNTKRNMNQEKLNFFIQSIFGFISIICAYIIWQQNSKFTITFQIFSYVACLCLLLFAYSMFKGKANRCNFNRNSVSIALIVSLMKELKKDEDIAYVFLDQGVNSFEGLRFLKEQLSNQELLLLDCLAYGDMVVCAHSELVNSKKIIENKLHIDIYDKCFEKAKVQKNMLSIYEHMLYLAVGNMQEKQFVITHTRSKQDYHVNIERVENIKQVIMEYLQG